MVVGWLLTGWDSDVFGIAEGPPLHDPLAVAAVLAGVGDQHEIPFCDSDPAGEPGLAQRERFEVTVVTEGTYEEARAGARTGQITARLLPPGEEGVRIPRSLDIPLFWKVLEECVSRADAANAAAEAAASSASGAVAN
jgi:uridine nucleosidase